MSKKLLVKWSLPRKKIPCKITVLYNMEQLRGGHNLTVIPGLESEFKSSLGNLTGFYFKIKGRPRARDLLMVECFSNTQEALGSVTSATAKQPNPDECSLSYRGLSLQAKLSRVKLPLEPCRGDPGSLSSFWSCQGSGDMFLEQSL